ncbi:hypothetical protein [Streptomyces sp. NPDC054975]
MRKLSAGRVARLAASVTAAGLVTVGMAAGPAAASSDQLWIVSPWELALPKAVDGQQAKDTTVALGLYHDNANYQVTDGKLTVDVSGLTGVADVTWPENCAPTGTTAVCSFPEVPLTGEAPVEVKVRAAVGAESGATGQITYEATATTSYGTMVAPGSTTTIRVASGPDLVLNQPAPVTGVAPGSTVQVPFSVVNNGNEPANGVDVYFYVTRGLELGAVAPQCTSTPLGEGEPLTKVECAFDDVVAPGGSFTLPSALQAKVAPYALGERIDIGANARGGVTDLEPGNNGWVAQITATNTADFAVRGGRYTAAAGETVRADVTFRNRGPAWVANLGSGDPVGSVEVAIPRGATATTVPDACEPRTADGGWWESEVRTGAPRYVCQLPMWVAEKQTVTFGFDLRVDTVVTGAKGAITLKPPYGTSFPFDPNAANHQAKLVLNPAA